LTRTALEVYLAELDDEGYSSSHRSRIKSVVGNFARWLIEEKALLNRNPAHGVHVSPQPVRAPRELTPEQRFILRELVEKGDDIRGEALFALGYWAGCPSRPIGVRAQPPPPMDSITRWVAPGRRWPDVIFIMALSQG
jgi:site-specific recombinase XerC